MDAAGHADYFTMIQQNGNINDQKEEASIKKWTRQKYTSQKHYNDAPQKRNNHADRKAKSTTVR